MFTLLFNFKLLSVFRCYRHYSTLLCIFVTIIHGSIGDTADSSTVRHGRIESTSIITNSSSLSQPPSSASSVSIKSHADDFSTSRKFNEIRTSTNDIRLEDFFLNGSGDEPLVLSLKSNGRLSASGFTGRETFIKTATVIATVYVGEDSSQDDENFDCTTNRCDNDEIPAYLLANKSYWIITRVFGALSVEDIPAMQERLMEMYRIAFARQQSIHLGLINTTTDEINDQMPTKSSIINETLSNATESNLSTTIQPTAVLKHENLLQPSTSIDLLQTDAKEAEIVSASQNISHKQKRSTSSNQTTQTVLQSTTPSASIIPSLADSANVRTGRKVKADKLNRNDASSGAIFIAIHNISVMTDFDYVDNFNQPGNVTVDPPLLDNQTEIIYSVFVSGIPVWAIIATTDMRLLNRDEVSAILEMPVAMIAEPYLKEPQATPLIPSSTNSQYDKPILAMLIQNPFIFTCLSVLLILVILLLMILMLVASSKSQRRIHKKSTSKSVQTAQHSFLPPVPEESSSNRSNSSLSHIQSTTVHEIPTTRVDAICEIEPATIRSQTKQVGTQITSLEDPTSDLTYERDHSFIIIPSSVKTKTRRSHRRSGTPKIFFPEPPPSSPSHQSSHSSTTPTSDASIYYIKKQKGRKHQVHVKRPSKQMISIDPREYATVNKKSNDQTQKSSLKYRQKYLKPGINNRIGAFDDMPRRNSSQSSADIHRQSSGQRKSDDSDGFDRKNAHLYEHIEAFNPLAGLQPKMLSQYTTTDGVHKRDEKANNERNESNITDLRNSSSLRKINEMDHQDLHQLNVINTEALNEKNKFRAQEMAATAQTEMESLKDIKKTVSNSDERHQIDNLSVGSFLSMASVKSFPKCQVPETLNEVLGLNDKTSLTKYDEIDATQAATNASRVPRIVDTKAKSSHAKPTYNLNNNEANKNHANRDFNYFTRSRSDATDPGVIGPIAFNFHKKRMENQDNFESSNDLISMQRRYEGLLDGALSLYSIETTELRTIETFTREDLPESFSGSLIIRKPD